MNRVYLKKINTIIFKKKQYMKLIMKLRKMRQIFNVIDE